jgi:predicted amidohydrolase
MKTIGKLKVAMCQFAVGRNITRNAERIREFLRKAAKAKADWCYAFCF